MSLLKTEVFPSVGPSNSGESGSFPRSRKRRNLLIGVSAVLLSLVPAALVKKFGDSMDPSNRPENLGRSFLPTPTIEPPSLDGRVYVPLLPIPVIQSGSSAPIKPEGYNPHTDAIINRTLKPEDQPGTFVNPADGTVFEDR